MAMLFGIVTFWTICYIGGCMGLSDTSSPKQLVFLALLIGGVILASATGKYLSSRLPKSDNQPAQEDAPSENK